MKREKLLLNTLFISLLLHLLFFSIVELYTRLILKGILGFQELNKERIFEVVPYVPKNISESAKPKKDTKYLGPKNVVTEKETIPDQKNVLKNQIVNPKNFQEPPKIDKRIEHDTIKQQKIEERQQTIALPPKEDRKTFEVSDMSKKEEQKKIKEETKPEKNLTNHQLPNISKLIPKSQDIIAKLPKEESINLNSGSVKGGKELIINTKEFKYWSYLQKIKQKIELVWEYPEYARTRGIGGQLRINFSIGKDGKIEQAILINSSGVKVLDDAALKALSDASPFPPFPDTWDISKLNIDGTFIYQITVIR